MDFLIFLSKFPLLVVYVGEFRRIFRFYKAQFDIFLCCINFHFSQQHSLVINPRHCASFFLINCFWVTEWTSAGLIYVQLHVVARLHLDNFQVFYRLHICTLYVIRQFSKPQHFSFIYLTFVFKDMNQGEGKYIISLRSKTCISALLAADISFMILAILALQCIYRVAVQQYQYQLVAGLEKLSFSFIYLKLSLCSSDSFFFPPRTNISLLSKNVLYQSSSLFCWLVCIQNDFQMIVPCSSVKKLKQMCVICFCLSNQV